MIALRMVRRLSGSLTFAEGDIDDCSRLRDCATFHHAAFLKFAKQFTVALHKCLAALPAANPSCSGGNRTPAIGHEKCADRSRWR